MPTEGRPVVEPDEGEAQLDMETGIVGQRLVIEGWFASHADSGTRGPHVHLRATGPMDPVLKTSQIPELVEKVGVVADRIERIWEAEGADYPFDDAPDDNDPTVIRQRRIGSPSSSTSTLCRRWSGSTASRSSP